MTTTTKIVRYCRSSRFPFPCATATTPHNHNHTCGTRWPENNTPPPSVCARPLLLSRGQPYLYLFNKKHETTTRTSRIGGDLPHPRISLAAAVVCSCSWWMGIVYNLNLTHIPNNHVHQSILILIHTPYYPYHSVFYFYNVSRTCDHVVHCSLSYYLGVCVLLLLLPVLSCIL